MPSAINVELNGQNYAVAWSNRAKRHLIDPFKVQPFREGFTIGGTPTPSDVEGVTTLIFADLSGGLGRKRINSNAFKVPTEYRRFWDSTLDTREPHDVRLPILAEESGGEEDVIRASESYKSNLWSIWDDASGTALVSRKYDGSETDWIAGGTVEGALAVDATSSGTASAGTTLTVAHACGTGTDRLLVVSVSASDDSTASETTIPTGVTYNSVAMTKLDGNAVNKSGTDQVGSSIWYLVAPTTGTNNIVATFGATMSDMALGGLSFTGADQGSAPMRTAGTDGNDNASSVSEATTSIAGDIVVDALAVFTESGDVSATVGASQTQIYNTRNQDVRGAMSRETATGTSTTMSWALGSSTAVFLTTGAVKQRIVVGLDTHAHKTHLLTLSAANDSHSIKRSTDGATFIDPTTDVAQNLLTNAVTANEDIDAGLLTTVGTEAVAVLWHESNGTITFFSSTNAGDVWTDEAVDIASGGGPKGVAVMTGTDGTLKLYVGTREGLWEIDTSPSTWTTTLIRPMFPHDDNCRRMRVGDNGALWFAYGVDDDAVPLVYNLFTHDRRFDFRPVSNDFSMGDGLPTARLGPIRWMEPAQGQMFVTQGGGKASRNASVWCHNGKGWHSMRKHGTANKKIEWLAASGDDDGTPRLHYAIRTATATSETQFLGQAFAKPTTGVTIKRELNGLVDLPSLDAGFPGDTGAWQSVVINGDDMGTTSYDYVNVDYAPDGVALGGNNLGDFTNTVSKIDFPSTSGGSDNGKGFASRNMALRVNLIRDSGDITDSVALKDVVITVLKQPPSRWGFDLTIDLDETQRRFGTRPEKAITNLETADSLTTNNAFTYPPLSSDRYVTVRRLKLRPDFLEEVSTGGAVDKKTGVERAGAVELVLEEVV